MSARPALLLVAGLGLTHAAPVFGQEPGSAEAKAAAEALFDEGKELLRERRYAAACERFEQSQQADAGVGTLLYLADCYEKVDRLASAWATFREAASAAREAGQTTRVGIAEERAEQLRVRLSKLTVHVPAGSRLPGIEVRVDGRPVLPALFGIPTPVDGGPHVVLAAAPGFAPWQAKLTIDPFGESQSLTVPVLEPVEAGDDPSARPWIGWSRQQWLGVVVGSVGLGFVAAGAGFGIHALLKDTEAADLCGGRRCGTQRGAELNDQARDSALLANIGYAIGAAALGSGAVLFFTAPALGSRVGVSGDRAGVALQFRGTY